MMCLLCQKQIYPDDRKFQVSSEKPYFNLMVHRDCFVNAKADIGKLLKPHLSEIMTNYNKKSHK